MTQWFTDMNAAPRGKMVPTPVKTKDGVKLVDQFRRERILAVHPDGDVQPSYWIPPRYTTEGTLLEGGRWSGFNRGADPIAWAQWPEYDFKAAPGDAAVTSGNDLRKPVAAEQGQIIREGDAPRETDRASGDASSPDTHSPEMAHETMGGTGDDCSFGNRGVWPPQDGASSSRGNDSLSVVTAGETATHFMLDDAGGGA